MKVIYKEPRTGKTTELIKMCATCGGYIVCKDEIEAKRIANQAKADNLKIPFPLTFYEFLNKSYHANGVKKVYIDNADMLIEYISRGIRVEAISLDDKSKWDKLNN